MSAGRSSTAIRPLQPEEMLANQRRADRRRTRASGSAAAPPPSVTTKNVEAILSIGDSTYFHFRGRAFGVPPLPWKAGQRITDAQARAFAAMEILSSNPLEPKVRGDYYAALGDLSKYMWANARPTGKWRRFLHALGLYRNPFAGATDRELLELADFFSSRRMKSGVPEQPAMARPRRSTSSTT